MPQPPRPLDDTASARAWFGVELRNWRRARRISAATLGKKVQVSGTAIERIEKCERPCETTLVDKLDEALDAGGALRRLWRRVQEEADRQPADADSMKPHLPRRESVERSTGTLTTTLSFGSEWSVPAVDRRNLLAVGGLTALAPAAVTGLIPNLERGPLPTVIRPEDIEQVRGAANILGRWDNLYGGGGIVREASIGLLHWAKDLLDVTCPPELRSSLFTAVGRLSIVMGASAFDAYEHNNAARLLAFGTSCAEAADNWHLRANALNWRSRQATWCGMPDDGLTHAENGLLRSDRLTPREQAMLHNARARALAKMRNQRETLAAIGRSDDIFHRAVEGEDAPWMAYYDHAQHHGDTGHALFDLAVLPGRSTSMAAKRLKTAIKEHTDAYVRSRALSGTKLATLVMRTGDPQEATHIAGQALAEVGRLRSRRAIDDVRDLASASMRYRRPEMAELRERIADAVRA
ncbi:helix-turn-helix domain-containing protein [Streptomyces sp. NPDC055036]